MDKLLIKSFIEIIPRKSFPPSLTKLHYIKDKNVFIATDSFILLEAKNKFLQFDSDFAIEYDDLKQLKNGVSQIKDGGLLEILDDKMKMYYIKPDNESKAPDYEFIFNYESTPMDTIKIVSSYSKFFAICYDLGIYDVSIKEKVFHGENQDYRIACRIPL